jgi:hypothetical protein
MNKKQNAIMMDVYLEIFPTERQIMIAFCFGEFSKRTISTEHFRSYVIINKITTFIISYV